VAGVRIVHRGMPINASKIFHSSKHLTRHSRKLGQARKLPQMTYSCGPCATDSNPGPYA